ncbi:hypothetical protein Tco_1217575 [Tanacetum coccineum]
MLYHQYGVLVFSRYGVLSLSEQGNEPDPRDVKIASLKQRIQELEGRQRKPNQNLLSGIYGIRKRSPVYDTDNEEEESMPVYDIDIEDVIEEEEEFVEK